MARKAKIKPKRPLRHKIERPEPKRSALPTPTTLHQWNTGIITVVKSGRSYHIRINSNGTLTYVKVTAKQALKAARYFGVYVTPSLPPLNSAIL